VVDEASQILENSLIGLLSRVKKYILIGDHLQLPAVVQQEKSFSRINNQGLIDLGFRNLAASLFERMFLTAVRNQWHHAIGQLTHQGRMHIHIMRFVNEHFYNNRLQAIPQITRLTQPHFFNGDQEQMDRLIFIPSSIDQESDSIKINIHEAQKVTSIIIELIKKYRQYDMTIHEHSIGIITPYRAQIAAIRQSLRSINDDSIRLITIDTVERYQGGARDIIIMSCCMNYSFQLGALISPSEEGIDRKLNVAITRAKEQFYIVGNPDIIGQDPTYKSLIEASKVIHI
jgi:DNA replication ATP-dependent helicase Dna2